MTAKKWVRSEDGSLVCDDVEEYKYVTKKNKLITSLQLKINILEQRVGQLERLLYANRSCKE